MVEYLHPLEPRHYLVLSDAAIPVPGTMTCWLTLLVRPARLPVVLIS